MPIPTSATKFERRSLSEIATEKIRDAILDGTLAPGERLNDKELEDWLGCSRTPIREALSELARLGLVELAAQRYTRVAAPTENDRGKIAEALGVLIGGLASAAVPGLNAEQRAAAESAVGDETWGSLQTLIHVFIDGLSNERLAGTSDQAIALAHLLAIAAADQTADLADVGAAIGRGDGQAAHTAFAALLAP